MGIVARYRSRAPLPATEDELRLFCEQAQQDLHALPSAEIAERMAKTDRLRRNRQKLERTLQTLQERLAREQKERGAGRLMELAFAEAANPKSGATEYESAIGNVRYTVHHRDRARVRIGERYLCRPGTTIARTRTHTVRIVFVARQANLCEIEAQTLAQQIAEIDRELATLAT